MTSAVSTQRTPLPVTADLRQKRRQRTQVLLSAAGFVSLLAAWWLAGDAARFLPGIGEVLSSFPGFLTNALVWQEVAITFTRVVGSLAIAFALAAVAALVMVRDKFWGRVVSAYVAVATAVPSTILALIALYIFRKSGAGVIFVVAVTTLPFIAVLLHEGLRARSASLEEMSTVYRMRGLDRVRHVLLPQITPYAFTALRNEYAHAWKVVVLAELFIINSGMGWQFSQAFDRFQLVSVMHWLLVFILILLATEYLIVRPLEARVLRWKDKA